MQTRSSFVGSDELRQVSAGKATEAITDKKESIEGERREFYSVKDSRLRQTENLIRFNQVNLV